MIKLFNVIWNNDPGKPEITVENDAGSRNYKIMEEIEMNRISKILENKDNAGVDFVVHVKSENELNDLIDVLKSHHFKVQFAFDFSPEEIDLWMKDVAKKDGFDLCFRIRNRENDKCVAYNPSVEYWRILDYDILENINGKLKINDGKYSLEDAKIEANKLYKDIKDYILILHTFGLSENADDEDIINKIASLVGFSKEELFG